VPTWPLKTIFGLNFERVGVGDDVQKLVLFEDVYALATVF
jgi:hypothetical protein